MMHFYKSSLTVSPRAFGCKVLTLVFMFVGFILIWSDQNARADIPAVPQTSIQMLQAINKSDWKTARRIVSQTREPLDIKMFYWFWLQSPKNPNPEYKTLVQFIRTHPDWPGLKQLERITEKKISDNQSARTYTKWFNDYPPLTLRGFFLYGDALIATGQTAKAKTIITDWWADKPLGRNDQKQLYSKYARYIDEKAHLRRLNNLIGRKQYKNARGVASVLGKGYPQLIEARIALASRSPDVNQRIAAVPVRLKNDPGLMYERLKWRRRKKLNEGAYEILMRPMSMDTMNNPRDWWGERHIIIRRYLEDKKFAKAYALAKSHKQQSGLGFAQAEFLSGWIALRFLNRPSDAFRHFEALYKNVKSPISRSRGSYWAGRAKLADNDKAAAAQWFQTAAQFQTAFYGQAAGAQTGNAEKALNAMAPQFSSAQKAGFSKDELIQAAVRLHFAGMKKTSDKFLIAFTKASIGKTGTSQSYAYAAELASDLRHYHAALLIAKDATSKGFLFTKQAYPVIPSFMKNVRVDWALVHGLIRQESQFDDKARSPAGALGLMQLMPATARETARKVGVRHSTALLTQTPSHNILLGSTYIGQMLNRYGGSYPLAIAAYNAGPGRVDRWVKEIGDPRLGQIDMMDWIELIPIYETRNYVQRVLEGSYVYGLRLNRQTNTIQTPFHVRQRY